MARVQKTECENLLSVLIELAQDSKFDSVFPALVAGAEQERWHIVERAKSLDVMKQIPIDIPESKRIVLGMLHTALIPAEMTSLAPWQNDKPFKAELDAARNLLRSVSSFCESCSCDRKMQ